MRIRFRVTDAHRFVGMGNEIALLSLPNLSLYFSLSSSFARKIVPPKWSAAVYRTTVTAYLGSRIFRRRTGEDAPWKCATLRYFTAGVHAIIVFLGRMDQSTAGPCPFLLGILREEGKFEISARRARAEYAAPREENVRLAATGFAEGD